MNYGGKAGVKSRLGGATRFLGEMPRKSMKYCASEKSEKSDKCGNSLIDNGRWEGFIEKRVKQV
jgi:hypothetical protein